MSSTAGLYLLPKVSGDLLDNGEDVEDAGEPGVLANDESPAGPAYLLPEGAVVEKLLDDMNELGMSFVPETVLSVDKVLFHSRNVPGDDRPPAYQGDEHPVGVIPLDIVEVVD